MIPQLIVSDRSRQTQRGPRHNATQTRLFARHSGKLSVSHASPASPMTQDELKQLVGQAAADYVNANVPQGSVIGVGTGSTANCFIDALAATKSRYRGAVSSSLASTARLQSHGFKVLDLNEIDSLPV